MQRPGCCCQQITSSSLVVTAVKQTTANEHSCCKEEVKPVVSNSGSGTCLEVAKPCCGMNATKVPALANSFQLPGISDEHLVKFKFSGIRLLETASSDESYVGEMNRAPPKQIGFGCTKTYLFKRALLI
jgi:hypothetical protein